jgi:hypothetical protein
MKLFNVLSIAALIFATVACSTGDMMDTESASVNTVASSAASDNAYLSLNINSNAVSTKAADETEATIAQTVTSCTVILYNNDGIQSINDNLAVAADGTVNTTLYTKARSDEKIMVIANSTVQFAGNVTTMDEVNEMIQKASSFNADNLVKVGTKALDFTTITPSSTTGATASNTLNVTVEVSQLTACVRLAGFNVVSYNGKAADVKLTNVTLNNVNLSEKTDGTEDHTEGFTTSSKEVNETVYSNGAAQSLTTVPTFFSFKNTSSSATSMTIDFTVGGKAYSKTYVINNGAVNSGVLYNLTVNMTINNNSVDVNFTTYTSDWAEGGTINIDMTRNN